MNFRFWISGFFALTLVVLIVIMALVGSVTAYLFTTGSRSTTHRLLSTQAYYLAEAGLERGTFALLTPHVTLTDALSKRYSCAAATFSNQALGEGVFTVNGVGTTPFDTFTTLSAAIGASDTTIPLASLTGFASRGRVKIDRESVDYFGTSTSTAVCGASITACLTGVVRGQDSTSSISHTSGTPVAQFQCTLQSQGGISNLTSPTAKRILKQAVQLQKAWGVGDDTSGEFIGLWDGVSWARQGPFSGIPDADLNAISALSYADIWAVGDNLSGSGGEMIIHWDGSSWTRFGPYTDIPNTVLNAVFCVNHDDCWLAGDAQGQTSTIAHWNGSLWSTGGFTNNTTNKHIHALFCLASNNCWGVGASKKEVGGNTNDPPGGDRTDSGNLPEMPETPRGPADFIIHWDGSSWSPDNSPDIPVEDLNGIFCVASNDCWAVGGHGTIVHYNGTSWSLHSDVGTTFLRDVSCISSSDCWTVGELKTFARWNGSSWSVQSPSGLPTDDYLDVGCYTFQDCWVVGALGTVGHWEGSSWSQATTTLPGVPIRNIDLIGPNQRPRATWEEDFY